jgi:hypothetical protein
MMRYTESVSIWIKFSRTPYPSYTIRDRSRITPNYDADPQIRDDRDSVTLENEPRLTVALGVPRCRSLN